MIVNETSIAAFSNGLKKLFDSALAAAKPNPLVEKLALRVPSTNARETWGWMEKISGMKKLIGNAEVSSLAANSYTIENFEWHDTIEVPQADIERDALGQYKTMIELMAPGSYLHDQRELASLIANGFTNKCYDGKTFFAADHAYVGNPAVTYSNKLTKKLSQANFRGARQMLRDMKDAAGNALELGADMTLIVSSGNEALAREILEAERLSNGATNVDRGTARVAVWSQLGVLNANAWFLADLGQLTKPITIQEEVKVQLLRADKLDNQQTIINHKFLYQAYKRSGYGYGFPQLIIGSDGSTAA